MNDQSKHKHKPKKKKKISFFFILGYGSQYARNKEKPGVPKYSI